MDKNQLITILEACLLANDSYTASTMHYCFGFNQKLAETGIQLYKYLQTLDLDEKHNKIIKKGGK